MSGCSRLSGSDAEKNYGFSLPLLPLECECTWNKQPDREKKNATKKKQKKKILHNSNFCTLLNSKEVDCGRDY